MPTPAPPFAAGLLAELRAARRVMVFTGAGVSAESGIPTFRDALTGLWQTFDPMDLATPEAFGRDPDLVWGWYEWRRMRVRRAAPNPAHRAIAALAARVPGLTVVTQNVDDLHERAGSPAVIHLHGSLHQPRCSLCAYPFALPDAEPLEPEAGRRLAPPRCRQCGGAVRPGVLWFGEALPADAWRAAEAAAGGCDLLFSVGTSGVVHPAAGLPLLAARRGATIVQVNPHPTDLDRVADHSLHGPAGGLLPALLAAAWGGE